MNMYQLYNRDAKTNEYASLLISEGYNNCYTCILNGANDFSRNFLKELKEHINDSDFDLGLSCTELDEIIREKLGYNIKSSMSHSCYAHQMQALALHLLWSKPKEKRKK